MLEKFRSRFLVSVAVIAATVATASPAFAQSSEVAAPESTIQQIQLPGLGQPPVRWTDENGTVHEAGALTLEQAKAGKQPERAAFFTEAKVVTVPADQAVQPKRQATGDAGAPGASACWYHNFWRGFENGAARVDGAMNWCGDGTWVRYDDRGQCWGQAWWPSYNYESCKKDVAYGAGWNVVELRVDWTVCVAYVPVGGYCGWKITVWDKYQYTGSGRINKLGGS